MGKLSSTTTWLQRRHWRPRAGYASVLLLTAGSQASSAFSLVALQFAGPIVADMYAVAIQTGLVGLNGVVIGIVYNIAIGRPHFRHWRVSGGAAAAVTLVAMAGVWSVVTRDETLRINQSDLAWTMLFYGVGGALLAITGVRAVRFACTGNARPFASLTIGPNVLLLLGVLAMVGGFAWAPFPALLWLLGVVGNAARIFSAKLVRTFDAKATDTADRIGLHVSALSLNVVTSSIVPVAMLLAVSALDPGTTALVFMASRIIGALVSLGVNSLLLVRYNWGRDAGADADKLAPFVFASFVVSLLPFAAIRLFESPLNSWMSYVMLGLAWVAIAAIGAMVGREANARRMSRAVAIKVCIDLIVTTTLTIILFVSPSVTGYFAILMTSQAVTILVFAIGMKRPRLTWASAICLFPSVALVIFGW